MAKVRKYKRKLVRKPFSFTYFKRRKRGGMSSVSRRSGGFSRLVPTLQEAVKRKKQGSIERATFWKGGKVIGILTKDGEIIGNR